MEAHVAVAKVGKYATSESGDTLEMIERPGGGISFVLADGQLSGKAAKAISNVVVRKAVSLLADGVRDGAAVRAASDYLYTYRSGKVQATLNILSFDLASQTIVISRNNPAPVIIVRQDTVESLTSESRPVGARRDIRPNITELGIEPGLSILFYTDGLVHAGDRRGMQLDVLGEVKTLVTSGRLEPARWADYFLDRALELDEGRPADDISVVVATVSAENSDEARRLTVRLPL